MAKRPITGDLSLTARGFGFVSRDNDPDILIPFDHLGTATSGDTVAVDLFPEAPADKPAGRITRVIKRSRQPIVGRVRWHGKELRLYPEGQRINRALVLERASVARFADDVGQKIRDGDVLAAQLLKWDAPADHPIGEPVEHLGDAESRDGEVALITRARGFSGELSDKAIQAARKLSIPKSGRLPRFRRDLRSGICFTIDPATAKDYDDALSVRQLKSGLFELDIHIADVSHFVKPGDPVDEEAQRRSTSVYLLDTVLPMLPERLSNELCSLVPNEDRYAVTLRAHLDSRGIVHATDVFESAIRSDKRFTYAEVEEILEGKTDGLAPQIHMLHLITQVLNKNRQQMGSVDLELSSPQIKLDKNGVPVSIRPNDRLQSQRMVEECMLLANQLVAERLEKSGRPGIYRVHDQPRATDVSGLLETLNRLGIRYNVDGEFTPDDYRNIFGIVENLEFRDFVEAVAAKALTKAVYTTQNRGHFGLAMPAYTHFTSPIRRYVDLMVHRLVKATFGGQRRPGLSQAKLEKACAFASERERAAINAERAFIRLKALQYLEKRLGRTYPGTISGVTSFGLFVEIDRYLVEGLVPIRTLGRERLEFNRTEHKLVGKKAGEFRLGDRVNISVVSVDIGERRAEFKLA